MAKRKIWQNCLNCQPSRNYSDALKTPQDDPQRRLAKSHNKLTTTIDGRHNYTTPDGGHTGETTPKNDEQTTEKTAEPPKSKKQKQEEPLTDFTINNSQLPTQGLEDMRKHLQQIRDAGNHVQQQQHQQQTPQDNAGAVISPAQNWEEETVQYQQQQIQVDYDKTLSFEQDGLTDDVLMEGCTELKKRKRDGVLTDKEKDNNNRTHENTDDENSTGRERQQRS